MDYTKIKRLSLKIFIGFLILAAVVAIVCVLGGEFSVFHMKVLMTTFAISAASMCWMACAAFIEKRNMARLGLAGIALSVAAGLFASVGIWSDPNSEAYLKTTATLAVAAGAFAYAFLLLMADLDDGQKWVQLVSAGSIGILGGMVAVVIWGEFNEGLYCQILAAVAIIVVLETAVVPVLMKLRKGGGKKRELLMLERIEGGRYKDRAGRVYDVSGGQ